MNTTTISLGGKEITLRASNWASQVYAEEFYGRLGGDYNGVLAHDISRVHADCFGDPDESGVFEVDLTPPPAFWGIVWALAYAAGSTKAGYSQWMKSKRNEIWTVEEQGAALYEVIALMEDSFFRRAAEQGSGESE